MTGRVAVLFLTHRWNPAISRRFERLRREIGERADVLVLAETSDEVRCAIANGDFPEGSAFTFRTPDLPGTLGYRLMRPGQLVPGSTHFPLLAFARENPGYALYVVVEFDVEFSGDWGVFLDDLAGRKPDFASSHFVSREQRPDWRWWRFLRPAQADWEMVTELRNFRRSFNPIYALSRPALDLVDAAHQSGWVGHYEVLLATLLTQRGCKIVDFAELGYCGSGAQDRREALAHGGFSAMRWRPPISPAEFSRRAEGRTLFHPVKDEWYFDGTRIVTE